MNKRKRVMAVVGTLLTFGLLAGCYNVPSDMTAIQMAGGLEDSKPKGCIKPGTRSNTPGNDNYVYFPISEREWDATGQDGSDSGRFTSVTNDNVEMLVPTTIRFSLVVECKTLTDFYIKYGRRYGVEFDSDGKYNRAWITLLRKLVADPADAALDRVVQEFNWRDVWNDPATKVKIEAALQEAVGPLMERQAKGKYFEGISVLVGKPSPKNADLAKAVALEQTNVAKSQSAEAQARADLIKAKAEIAVQQAEAAKKRADLSAFESEETYLKELCIKTAGCQPFPSPIIPGVR